MYVAFDVFLYACAPQIGSQQLLFAILESCSSHLVFMATVDRTERQKFLADVIRVITEKRAILVTAKAGVQHFVPQAGLAFRASGGLREIVWMAGIG